MHLVQIFSLAVLLSVVIIENAVVSDDNFYPVHFPLQNVPLFPYTWDDSPFVRQWYYNNYYNHYYNPKPTLKPKPPPAPAQCTTTGCGTCTTISPTSGSIQSPNFPEDYGTDRKCVYKIVASVGKKIQLTFTSFSLNGNLSDPNNPFSYKGDCVNIMNNRNLGWQDVFSSVTASGTTPPSPFTSLSNEIQVTFLTNGGQPGVTPDSYGISKPYKWQATFHVI